jgi:hypothetical protein
VEPAKTGDRINARIFVADSLFAIVTYCYYDKMNSPDGAGGISRENPFTNLRIFNQGK